MELGRAANLWSSFPKVKVYTKLMEESGYHVGIEGKGWGPGDESVTGWKQNPGGARYNSFEDFYNEVEKGQPWLYWYSSRDPHRPYIKRDGKNRVLILILFMFRPIYLIIMRSEKI